MGIYIKNTKDLDYFLLEEYSVRIQPNICSDLSRNGWMFIEKKTFFYFSTLIKLTVRMHAPIHIKPCSPEMSHDGDTSIS